MLMKNNFIVGIVAAIILATTVSMNANIFASESETENEQHATVVRDSVTILLGHHSIPSQKFIHLYDSTPYMIVNGHIALNVPCDNNSQSQVQVLIGQAPNLAPSELEIISELSDPGKSCLYHVDLESHPDEDKIITDIALYNPSAKPVNFKKTDTVVIGVNEIMPLEDDHHEE
jgi:hypothetical protein